MIELKLGRPVIAWDTDERHADKGHYIIYNQSATNPTHVILFDGEIIHCRNVKPDLSAHPMNGDEVKVSNDGSDWHTGRVYIGQKASGAYICENKCGDMAHWPYVRHPQPSKRERVRELLPNTQGKPCLFDWNVITDQIDKIYEAKE